jgi:excisionase family DNA binding protein
MPNEVKPLAVTPAQAAQALNLSLSQIYDLMRRGALASFKTAKSRRITMASIEALMAKRAPLGGEPTFQTTRHLPRDQRKRSRVRLRESR